MKLLSTTEEVLSFLSGVQHAPFLALDTETTGLDPHLDRVLLVQVGTADAQALIDASKIPVAAIRAIFDRDQPLVMHNAKFDLKMLEGSFGNIWGGGAGPLRAPVFDSLVAEQLLRNGRRTELGDPTFGLKSLAERYAGMSLDKTIRQGFQNVESISELSETELRYAQRDVEATYKVFSEQLPRLTAESLLKVFAIECAACLAFSEMEFVGVALDSEKWAGLIEKEKVDGAEAKKVLDKEFWSVVDHDLFGHSTLNYDSEQEVQDALHKLGLALESTRKEALLASGHPAALALAEYREHHKLVTTYGDGFLAHVHAKTGRLHPDFHPIGAVTGRASCSEPNLQNIPQGSSFRSCFAAPPGRKLITADYAGAELRIIAEVSKDPVFLEAFQSGKDLHAIVAQRIFKKTVSKHENTDLRARAKAINFGLAYGMGAQGLANQIGVKTADAERLLEEYFRSFPKIRDYLNRAGRSALERGVAETVAGRKFWLIDMRRSGKDEGTQMRVGKNMPIQGSNADITKLAMARMFRAFRETGMDAHVVNMVHDEIVVEAAEADAETALNVVVREMMSAGAEFISSVPMTVDATISDTWQK